MEANTLDTLARFDAAALDHLRRIDTIEGVPVVYRLVDGNVEPHPLLDLLQHKLWVDATYTANTLADLVRYVTDHGDHGTRTFVAVKEDGTFAVNAVLDAFLADGATPGRARHRAAFEPRLSRRWKLWSGWMNRPMGQRELAHILEDRAHDIADPVAAELREIVLTFRAGRNVKVTSIVNEDTTDVVFGWETETTGSGRSKRGEVSLPHELTVKLEPFDGMAPQPVTVRLAYGVDDDGLSFTMRMPAAAEILESAAQALAGELRGSLNMGLVYDGTARF